MTSVAFVLTNFRKVTISSLKKFAFNTLLMVVPGFGIIYQLTDSSTNHLTYAQFIKKAFKVVRSLVCLPNTPIIMIHDNAAYHVVDRVPYSLQLNEPAEACFGFAKHAVAAINRHSCINKGSIVQAAKANWRDQLRKYDARMSATYFNMWVEILHLCKEGRELTDQSIEVKNDFIDYLRDFQTLRE